jgi:hypothetical protein
MIPDDCCFDPPYRCPKCGHFVSEETEGACYAPITHKGLPAENLDVGGSWMAIYCGERCYDQHVKKEGITA